MKRLVAGLLLTVFLAGSAAARSRAVDHSAEWRAHLTAVRAKNIAILIAYTQAGQFPRNEVTDTKFNIFRDDRGVLCAVANIMFQNGEAKLVDQTARTNNFVRLGDVRKGPLLDWIQVSGFTQEEIQRIQEPYMPYEPSLEDEERERVQRHLFGVIRQLQQDTPRSIETVMTRLPEGLVWLVAPGQPFPPIADRVEISFAQPPPAR
jgi:hypothetical protein